MRGLAWDDGRIELLKRLWAEGKTAAAIAKALGGLTRAAVLGKIHRLRLAVDSTGMAAKVGAKRAKKSKAGKSRHAARGSAPSRRRRGKNAPAVSASKGQGAGRKTLFDLTNECCRWPHGRPGMKNFFFCAATGADVMRGIPYCAHHMRRAYLIPPAIVHASRAA